MSKKYLGEEIDIHAGGEDLIFPHHENEIAQSECCNGKLFAKYWMHNGFLNIDNRKMSKSLGNFRTVREISQQYDLQVLRFFKMCIRDRIKPVGDGAETYLLKSEGFYCLKEDGTRHEESAVHYFDHMEIDGTVLDGFYYHDQSGHFEAGNPHICLLYTSRCV